MIKWTIYYYYLKKKELHKKFKNAIFFKKEAKIGEKRNK